jgi:hypothetical protein
MLKLAQWWMQEKEFIIQAKIAYVYVIQANAIIVNYNWLRNFLMHEKINLHL